MGSCEFSIIVPVYKVEAYLERCVDSLLAQTWPDYEIILVDDGSPDGSGAICEEYADRDGRVRVFHKENGGLSSARNYGIDRAKGKYVLFVDSDDYVDAGLCAALHEALGQSRNFAACAGMSASSGDNADVSMVYAGSAGADACIYGGVEEDGQSVLRSIRSIEPKNVELWDAREYMKAAYAHRNLNVQAWLYAWRRDFLNERRLRFQEGILHEDVEFTPRALLAARQVMEVPGEYYHYVVRDGSISTGKNREKNIRDLFATLEMQSGMAMLQEPGLRRWMLNGILDSYLNMIQEARMYRPEYRKLVHKTFLWGKAATPWNRVRVALCTISVRLYCRINDGYKKMRG